MSLSRVLACIPECGDGAAKDGSAASHESRSLGWKDSPLRASALLSGGVDKRLCPKHAWGAPSVDHPLLSKELTETLCFNTGERETFDDWGDGNGEGVVAGP